VKKSRINTNRPPAIIMISGARGVMDLAISWIGLDIDISSQITLE
jgi:hypothetical protein